MALARDLEADAFARSLDERGHALIDLSKDARVMALIDRANDETERWHGQGFNRVQDAWRRSPAVRALATLPQIADALASAYGAEPYPFQTLNFFVGSQQRAHSDMIHFTPDPPHLMCGVWLALEDVREDTGPVFYLPGSHTLPVLDLAASGAPAGMNPEDAYRNHYEPVLEAGVAGMRRETALLRKGQAFVWAANLVHGGSPVRDRRATRRSLVTHYFFKSAEPYTLMHSRRRRAYRLPTDIRTGRFVWPRTGAPSLKTFAAALYARLCRKVFTFGAVAPKAT
ncbi:MAG: phytanoyl-CoA dioxygenase family protein [Hyphomonadaceae bacterium]